MFGFGKPWLKRKFKDNTVFEMKIDYIIKHLDKPDKKKVEGKVSFFHQEDWQNKKEQKIHKALDSGKKHSKFDPIRLALHTKKEQFRVGDGISRLRAFKKKEIEKIKVELCIGEW